MQKDMKPEIKNLPTITVILPTLNGEDVIRDCLASIKNQSYTKEKIKTIVVDNGSTDKTAQLISKNFPQTKLVRIQKNIGSAPALNIAAKLANTEYILATNDDVTFEKNCLKNLVFEAESDSSIGIVTGKMMSFTKPHKFSIPGFKINHYLGYHPFDLKNIGKVRECDWAVGACILVKTNLLKKIGYFDPDYIFCGEEYDLSFRIRLLGLKIIYTPKAVFYHRFKRNLKPNQNALFAHYRGKFRYMFKNGRLDHLLVFLPAQLIVSPILCFFLARGQNISPIYKAFYWNLKNLKKTLKIRPKKNLDDSFNPKINLE